MKTNFGHTTAHTGHFGGGAFVENAGGYVKVRSRRDGGQQGEGETYTNKAGEPREIARGTTFVCFDKVTVIWQNYQASFISRESRAGPTQPLPHHLPGGMGAVS